MSQDPKYADQGRHLRMVCAINMLQSVEVLMQWAAIIV